MQQDTEVSTDTMLEYSDVLSVYLNGSEVLIPGVESWIYNSSTGFSTFRLRPDVSTEGAQQLVSASVSNSCVLVVNTNSGSFKLVGHLTFLGYNRPIPSHFYFTENVEIF